jgi:hypothetical protein
MQLFKVALIFTVFLASNSYPFELIIKPGPETKPEEKKEEEKKPELPSRSQLSLNVINLTQLEFVVGLEARSRDENYKKIVAQYYVKPDESLTMATFIDTTKDAIFSLLMHDVHMMKPFVKKLICTIKPPASKEEPKATEDKSEGEKIIPESEITPSPSLSSTNQAPEDSSSIEIKKSIDVYLYKEENQALPQCVIHIDSL